MLNVICVVKQVPDTEAHIRPDPSSPTTIITSDVKFILNPYDEYAMETALVLKDAGRATVTAVTLGVPTAKSALQTCLAMGADEAVLLSDPAFEGSDPYSAAIALAAWLKTQRFDLVLTGKQAIDDDAASVSSLLAEFLDLPQVLVVTRLEIDDTTRVATCIREVEGGNWRVETSLPAVISCQKGERDPRYPSLRGIMMAKKKDIPTVTAAALGLDAATLGRSGARTEVTALELPAPRPAGRILQGDADATVRELAKLFREEVKVV